MNWPFVYNVSLALNILSAGGIFLFLVFAKVYHDQGARLYMLLSFGVVEWSLFFFLSQTAGDLKLALKFFTIAKLGLIFTSSSFLAYSLIYAESFTKRSFKWLIRFVYGLGVVIIMLFLSDAFLNTQFLLKGGGPIPYINFWAERAGPIFDIYMAYFFGCFTLGISFWVWIRLKVEKSTRHQADIVLWSSFFAAIGGGTQYLYYYGLYMLPLGTFFVPLYVIGLFYTITKFHLFNLKVVTAEFFIFGIWAILAGQIFLTGNINNITLTIIVFIFSTILGLLTLRSTINEAQQKNELIDLNQNLEAKVAEQTKEIRHAYEVEKVAHEELEELDKAKTEFILASQHNLRTPLTITKGYVEEIENQARSLDNHDIQTSIDKTKSSLDILAQLVNGLIDVTDLKVGKEGFSKNKK